MSLLEAVKANDVARVRELVSDGLNQNEASWALRYAVNRGYLEIVRLLIHADADVNRELLMVHKENKNLVVVEGSALRDAALEGHLDIVEELLRAGANANYVPRNSDEGSALMLAAQEGHFKIVKRLVEAGADVNVVKDGSSYALFSAADNGYKDIFDFLYPLTAPELRQEALKVLPEGMQMRQIEEEADPLVCELTDTILERNTDRVRKLLTTGVDINSYDETGSTPLLCAIAVRSIELVRILLAAGANPDMKDIYDGETPLILSARIRSEDEVVIASLLLEAGCDVNAQDKRGFTALMRAVAFTRKTNWARQAQLKGIQLLLESGADISIKNCEGKDVFELVLTDDYEVVNLIK